MRHSREEILSQIKDLVNEEFTGINVEEGVCGEFYIEYRLVFIPFDEPFNTRLSFTRNDVEVVGTEIDPGIYNFAHSIANTCFDMDDELEGVDVVLVREEVE